MMLLAVGVALTLGHSEADGPGPVVPDVAVVRCQTCGVETTAVVDQIVRLQKAPSRREREQAARALRKVDWHCHPQVLGALAFSLLHDCDGDVREEVAQTLTKLAPCVPVVHEALRRSAACDPDRATRKWAGRGLRALATRCEAPCNACGTATGAPVALPGDAVILPGTEIPARPPAPGNGTVIEPPADLIPSPPVDSRVVPPAGLAPLPPSDPAPGDGLDPLPPPAEEPNLAPKPAPAVEREADRRDADPRATRPTWGRPRVASLLPRFLRPNRSR
jgi:hypothetical protein